MRSWGIPIFPKAHSPHFEGKKMAMMKLTKIVGQSNILDDPEILFEYSRDMSFVSPLRPRCVVKPRSADEVAAIVRWAYETGTPLLTVSSTEPRFRGDTVPGTGGVVVVDLSGLKRIIRVDRRNRVAMIEPGVTFGELIPALEKEDLAPFMPLMPRSGKSALTSALEREPITVPRLHWDSQDPLLCLEVYLGTGDLFRTGSATGPGSIEEQWEVGRAQIRPMGPSQMDPARYIQCAQGSMGIVTWITLKCKILPKVKKAFLVSSATLEGLIEFSYKILWKRLGDDCFIVNGRNLAGLFSKEGEGIEALSEELPPWILFWSAEGIGLFPEERVKYQEAELKELAQFFGLEPEESLAGISAVHIAELLSKPSSDSYWKLRSQGGCHDIFFLSTLDKTPIFLRTMHGLQEQHRYSGNSVGVYLQPTLQGTNCHVEFSYTYDPENLREMQKVQNIDKEASKVLPSMGAFFSRPYGSWTEVAFGPSAYTVIALRKIKEVYDPKGIMNPGKLCF